MRESRVKNPFLRSAGRSSGLKREIARDKPMRTAPACPPTPPPFAVHDDVHLVRQVRELQRLDRIMLPRMIRKILLRRPAVHRELAGACAQEHARDRLFAAAGAEKP